MKICKLPGCNNLVKNWRWSCCSKSHQGKFSAKSNHNTLHLPDKTRDEIAAYYRYKATERQARIKKATPSWANKDLIREFYKTAVRLTNETGIMHEVDHSIPIKGKLVCGLHVETNLEILTFDKNRSKSNRYFIEN